MAGPVLDGYSQQNKPEILSREQHPLGCKDSLDMAIISSFGIYRLAGIIDSGVYFFPLVGDSGSMKGFPALRPNIFLRGFLC